MGRLSFAGPGALDLIQKVWTNNAATMKDFQVRYGLVCNANGGVRDDVLVYRWPYLWELGCSLVARPTSVRARISMRTTLRCSGCGQGC